MSAQIEESGSYAVLGPAATVKEQAGYAALKMKNAVPESIGYAATTLQRGIPETIGYVVIANPATIAHTAGYAPMVRPAANVISHYGLTVLQTQYPPYEELDLRYTFMDRRFPESISYGSSGGPGFRTSLFAVDSGMVTAQPEWERLRASYDVQFEHATGRDIDAVEDFFYGMRGKAIGFRFKDWSDYQITKQNIAIGDGKSTAFQLFKRYRSGGFYFDRMIRKPVRKSLNRMYVDDVEVVEQRDFDINPSTGVVNFRNPPARGSIVNIDYIEFDVPVRFDVDELMVEAVEHDQYAISNLTLIEVLV